jgi:hypothetical protein
MSEAWQSAWVEILPDFKNFKTSANSQMSGVLGAAGTAGGLAAGRNMGAGLLGSIKGLAGPLIGIVAALGIGRLIGEAIGSGINYALNSVDLASDLEQSTGAVRSVFKEQSSIVEGFADGAAKNVGLAKTSYQTFATVVGAQLKNLGIPFDQIAGQTDDLIGLGADLSAQFGGSTSDAVNALSSLLRGERDPVERYGVGIKQSDINARLAAKGLGDLTGEAKKQAEIQATLAILYEQTTDAQGTFAREGDTLAGQQQRLQAVLTDTQTAFGEALLPAFSSASGFALETLVPALERVLENVGPTLGDALSDLAPKFEELVEKATPLAEAFIIAVAEDALPALIQGLNDFLDSVPLWIEGFKDVDGAIRDLTDNNVGLGDLVAGFALMGPNMIGALGVIVRAITDTMTSISVSIALGLATGIVQFSNFIRDVQTNIGKAGDDFRDSGEELIKNFAMGITAGLTFVAPAINDVMEFVAGFFPHSPAERGPFSGSGWIAIGSAGAAVADEFANGFNKRPAIQLGAVASGVSSAAFSGIRTQQPAPIASSGGGAASVNVYPQPGMSEETIGRVAAAELNWALRSTK